MIRRLTHNGSPLIIHTCPPPGRKHSGFTLLELLVVLVVIGVMVSMAVLSFGVLGRDSQAEEEARRFWVVLQQAREEAELQVEDLGIYIGQDAYEFLRFDSRKNRWELIEYDELFAQRELPAGLRFRLRLESREIVLKPGLPERAVVEEKKDGDEDEDEKDERSGLKDLDDDQKFPPHVMVLSSGEVMPFELEIEREGQPALWRVTGLANNDLRVENRDERNEWGPLLQTKPPPENDRQRPTRVSSARP
ncbi:MAG TPA: type II secretion system minor pseudopilin GspH [Steroidobacter sp.]|uniref:type II secretion system minor pseudopilin GspH n=1 Tax=Steroidobacter sp. TaxID=1978227 RepID=UPI002EDAC4CE